VHKLSGLQIRYLDIDGARMAPLHRGLPVGALLFPRYEAGAALRRQRISPAQTLTALCQARSLLDSQPDVFAETLRWVESVPAYRLSYGSLDRAVEQVWSLLRAP
jgi:hypothetical protein